MAEPLRQSHYQEFPNTQPINFRNTLTQDPYEWKFPNRKETMYLSTIRDQDVGFNKYAIARDSRGLYTKDIVDSKTRVIKNESYSLKNDDIEQSGPKRLHQPLNKPYYYLRDDDIPYAKPSSNNSLKTKREPSNPLNPVYKLASFEPLEPVVPKFIRDSINVNDIEGTKPKNAQPKHQVFRESNFVKDIDGARPKKDYVRKDVLSPLDVKDINEFRMFKTTRVTNPLEPNYVVSAEAVGEQEVIGFIEGSKSRILHHNLPHGVPENTGCLVISDIDGSKVGTVGNRHIKSHFKLTQSRGQYRHLTETKDIFGAQTGTLKKGIQTNRHLNPLNPEYKVPGHIQDKDYVISTQGQRIPVQRQGERSVASTSQHQPSQHLPQIPQAQTVDNKLFESAVVGEPQPVQTQSIQQSQGGDLRPVLPPVSPAVVEQAKPDSRGGREVRTPPPLRTGLHTAPTGEQSAASEPFLEHSVPVRKALTPMGSQHQEKPLHKRIDREEYVKDVQNFYGHGPTFEENQPTKISKIIEQIDNQKKVMNQLDKKQKDVYTQTKIESRKTAAQKFDKFIQTT